ncbi:MAG: hypothetical protein HY204_04625 [Nitrospirae bacterium]|nr:hypothetical protein [Nitrospirota bacterium]
MNRLWVYSGLVVLVLGGALAGCASNKPMVGAESLVETSGDKPDLVKKNLGFAESNGYKYFVGTGDQSHDMDVGIRSAELTGKQHIVEAIAADIRSEALKGLSGTDRDAVGRFIEDSVALVTSRVRVSGAFLERPYWEKYQRNEGNRLSYYYRSYAVVKISNEDYAGAAQMAADIMIQKAIQEKDRRAEQAARGAKERLLGIIEKEQ